MVLKKQMVYCKKAGVDGSALFPPTGVKEEQFF